MKHLGTLAIAVAICALETFRPCALEAQSAPSAPAPAATSGGARKLDPGHYMLPYRGDTQRTLLTRVDEVCREPALQGMELRPSWADLESKPGTYTFGNFEQIYERLAACKKRLMLEVWFASFDGRPDGIVPDDLKAHLARTKSGYIVQLWKPEVMDRFVALYQALGKRFDHEPYFEGIIVSETATSKVQDPTYTPAALIEQLTRGLEAIRAAWPSTNVIVFDNYISGASNGQFVSFVRTLERLHVGVGGPDVLPPPNPGTMGERIYRGEVGGTDFRGRVPSAFAVQAPELGGSHSATPQQLYDHCAHTNRCTYMFWLRNTAKGSAEQKWDSGILPFLRAHPTL